MIAGRDYLIPIEADPDKNRAAWLSERRRGHGGTDVTAIIGENPSKGPIDVWRAHVEGYVDERDSERARAGRFFEPHVLDWFARGGDAWPRAGGPMVVCKPPTVYHRDRPWQLGSVDGLAYDPSAIADIHDGAGGGFCGPPGPMLNERSPNGLGEVKTHGWYGSRGYDIDDEGSPLVSVPPEKRVQCEWYMELYDVDVTYLAALIDTHMRRTFVIPRDREVGVMLLTEVEEFRRKHILTGIAPPPDGKASYRDYLKQRFKKHGTEIIDGNAEVDIAAEALILIKRDMKKLEADKELAEQVLKRAIGENSGVKTSSGIVTWKSQRSGKYRDKDFRAELYKIAGLTPIQIAELEDKYAQPDNRVLRTSTK